jgi:hypothetical protein
MPVRQTSIRVGLELRADDIATQVAEYQNDH